MQKDLRGCLLFRQSCFGAITGQMTQAIIIGATISALYVSVVPAGNNTPADSCAAGAIAIPIALMSHMDVAAASALAVSVAIIAICYSQFSIT